MPLPGLSSYDGFVPRLFTYRKQKVSTELNHFPEDPTATHTYSQTPKTTQKKPEGTKACHQLLKKNVVSKQLWVGKEPNQHVSLGCHLNSYSSRPKEDGENQDTSQSKSRKPSDQTNIQRNHGTTFQQNQQNQENQNKKRNEAELKSNKSLVCARICSTLLFLDLGGPFET